MKFLLSRVVILSVMGAAMAAPVNSAFALGCDQYDQNDIDTDDGHHPQNVVLIVIDDSGVSDIPSFNPPVVWKDNDTAPLLDSLALREASHLRPELNRFVARSLAERNGNLGTVGSSGPIAVPGDLPSGETPGAFQYTPGGASDPVHDVLKGFGGLGRLAKTGVVIRRHYAPSAVCSPSRAGLMTGRHPSEVGVPTLDNPISLNEITIPDFLKNVVPNSTYRTGIVGKWHLGADQNHQSRNYFHEVFGYRADYRNDFESDPLDCKTANGYLGPEENGTCLSDREADPLCCPPSETYDFSKKMLEASLYWQPQGTKTVPSACDDDDETLPRRSSLSAPACQYGTRYYADAARNFILRNRAQPFFLYVATHAVHYKNQAPARTSKHYATLGLCRRTDPPTVCHSDSDCGDHGFCKFKTKSFPSPESPSARQNPEGYWPAFEELDAAVGKILGVIEGFCTQPGVFGDACVTNADCGHTECNHDLSTNTLVLLTSDHGHDGSTRDPGYGVSILRGGKLSHEEGGIRVGLSAWYGNGELGSQSEGDLDAISKAVTSHVDILPTIAHAAGCKPDTNGQYTIGVCSGPNQREVCTSNSDCASQQCIIRKLSGHTLLPLLSTRVRDYDEGASGSIGRRPYVFAERKRADPAIIAANENIADIPQDRVCGRSEDLTTTLTPVRHAGSTTWCEDVDDCTSVSCSSNGKFCVPALHQTACENGSSGCDWQDYRRCTRRQECTDYDKYMRCMPVEVPCIECPQSSWKLRMNAEGNQVTALFDLATNPEEINGLNLASVPAFADVKTTLFNHLKGWYECVKEGTTDSTDCETCYGTGVPCGSPP